MKIKILVLTSFLFFGLFVSLSSTSAATTKILYAWVKDAAGNISNSQSANVDITLPAEPANTYYISPSGNDTTGTGTTTNPWKSLYKACNSVTTSGTTIHVKAGTYTETLSCNLAVGVSIEGEGNTSVIQINIPNNSSYGAINLVSSISKTNGNQSISNIKIVSMAESLETIAIQVLKRSNVKIHDSTISNFQVSAISIKGVTPAYTGFNGTYVIPTIYETGNEIYNSVITDCSDRAVYASGGSIDFNDQEGLLIHDNILRNDGLPDNRNGDIIAGWWGFFKELKIYNNKFYKPLIETTGWNFTMEIGMSYGGNEVYNNEFHNGVGLDIAAIENVKGTYGYSWWIHDNLFQMDRRITKAEDYHGMYALCWEGTNEDAIFNNNHIINYPNGTSVSMMQSPRHTSNIKIHNNLFEAMGHSDNLWSFVIPFGNSAGNILENVYIDNNTMIGSSGAIHFVNDPSAITRNIYFRNNIVKDVVQYGWIYTQKNTGGISDVYLSNNDTYNNVGSNRIWYESGATAITNLVQSGNITTDPLFTSSTDFHLQPTSPAINKGIDVGLPYNGSAPDIGAYESSSVLGVSTYHFTLNLKQGSKGNEVKELQKILISGGYLKISTPTETFGSLTKKALIEYQKANNLNPDGLVGKDVRGVLNK
jgi:hypothetical protein